MRLISFSATPEDVNKYSDKHGYKIKHNIMDFKLQFSPDQILSLAAAFSYSKDENALIGLKPKVLQRGYLNQDELKDACLWKTERSKSRVAENLPEDIKAITKVCFESQNERLRIGSLLLLDGVNYPSASVILHFFHADPYPILDFRALEALGIRGSINYTFDFWIKYVHFTRDLSKKLNIDMRTLDKALWQWSKSSRI